MSNYQYITTLLDLKEAIVKNIVSSDQRITITLEMPRKAHVCPRCQTKTDKIHDYRLQKVHALPIQCWLIVRKRRYVCPSCGKRFKEDKPYIHLNANEDLHAQYYP